MEIVLEEPHAPIWEVRYIDDAGKEQVQRFEPASSNAQAFAHELRGKGIKCKAMRSKTDVYVISETGVWCFIGTTNGIAEAARWAFNWAKGHRTKGCLLWPHGQELPEGLRTIDLSKDFEEPRTAAQIVMAAIDDAIAPIFDAIVEDGGTSPNDSAS